MKINEKPLLVSMSPEEIEGLQKRLKESGMSDNDQEILINCVRFSTWMPAALEEKDVSIANLRRVLFGDTGKRRKKKSKDENKDSAENTNEHSGDNSLPSDIDSDDTAKGSVAKSDEKNSQNEGNVINLDCKRPLNGALLKHPS